VSLIVKSALNVLGWIFLAVFYDDFQAHIDYMDNFNMATEEELLEAKRINCGDKNGKKHCGEFTPVSEQSQTEDSNADGKNLDDFEADGKGPIDIEAEQEKWETFAISTKH